MEEPAVQQEKIEKSQEQGEDRRKADWKNECSFSNLLKHSCFICWTSPGDTDVIEMDDRVLAKAAEIRVRPQHLPLICWLFVYLICITVCTYCTCSFIIAFPTVLP
uniref:Uncharacterized protein n=1 Tax=Poecilia formosa TaxID=48698 RepID=A0A096M170_POEFO